jgi:uncharacterized protein DUF6924
MAAVVFNLPDSNRAFLLRTDYSDESAWTELCGLVEAPYEDGFQAYLTFVSDPWLAGKTVDELMALMDRGGYRSFFFVADREALTNLEHPVLAVDLHEKRGRTFRVIPSQMWAVENNLSLGNLEFSSFADNVDSDGVLRGKE